MLPRLLRRWMTLALGTSVSCLLSCTMPSRPQPHASTPQATPAPPDWAEPIGSPAAGVPAATRRTQKPFAPAPAPASCSTTYLPPFPGPLAWRVAYGGAGDTVHHCSRWSQFGPVRPHGNWHKGIDIYAPTGTPVAAAVSGQLAYAHDPGGWGLYARIQLDPRQAGPDGTCRTAAPVELIYAHLDDDDPNLRTGVDQPVLAGSIIGRVGCSGNASSMCSPSPESHLHFSVRHGSGDRAKVDPLPVVGWLLFEPHASMFSPPLARCPWP